MKKMMIVPLLTLVLLFSACQHEVREQLAVGEPLNIAVLVDEGFHDGEAYMPIGYLSNRGAELTVIGPERGLVTAYNSDFTILIQQAVHEVSVDDFDALILPGGQAPASLREREEVVEFARDFFETGRVVAAICHGPQVLITAGVMHGKNATGFGGIQEELEDAGVNYHDESVVIDGNLITSRTPPDLYDFALAIEQAVLISPTIEDMPPQPAI